MNDKNFCDQAPIKLTEACQLQLNTGGWGLLSEYYLESVKITNYKKKITSSATVRISDTSGQVTCIIKGPCIGRLFGLTTREWMEVEKLCDHQDQLFYRYFKNGVNNKFNYEQKLFYNFCLTSQKHDILVAIFKTCKNTRTQFKDDTLLEIRDLQKYDNSILDLYLQHLRYEENPQLA